MTANTPRIEELETASWLVYDHVLDYYEDKGPVHPETVIATVATLAGEQILRACLSPQALEGTGPIASEKAHLLLCLDTENSTVLEAIQVSSAYGPEDAPDMAAILMRTKNAVGTTPFPPITVPQKHQPKNWSLQIAATHRDFIAKTKTKQKLSDFEMAVALGFCIGEFMEEYSEKVPLKISLQLAMEIMAGVIRLRPVSEAA